MYLSKLEIVGFKSFAQKTQLKFSPGITAIVGPNGCGKTNIVDAIRWVLGEQKSAILRSELMENVIFNGTSNRKALGMSEVLMTIKNNKSVLPTEYSEVTLTRRLFRDGESQYLLNNVQCRLKDIVDLFMDTGVGADTYSVIELKMIEAILSGVPKERRHLLEEAAGITKYKQRRKEASKKLQLIQSDLTRVQDIVSEVEKNVAALSRQAAKTRKFNKLSEELKELEMAMYFTEFNKLQDDVKQFDATLEELQNQKSAKDKETEAAEENLLKLEKSLHDADTAYQLELEKENIINSKIAAQNKELAVIEEKIYSLSSSLIRIKEDVQRNRNSIQEYSLSIIEAEKNINERDTALADLNIQLTSGRESLTHANSKVNDARESVNEANENVLHIQNRISSLNLALKKNEFRSQAINDRILSGEQEIEKALLKISETDLDKQNTSLKVSALGDEIENIEKEFNRQSEYQKVLQSEISVLKDRISQHKIDLSGKNASVEFLKGILATDDSIKFLAGESSWKPSGDKSTLAELIGTDDEYRIAVEAALGTYSNMFVVSSEEDAYSAIELLRKNEKGKASFLCREKIPNCNAPAEIANEDGIIGWISEIVRTDDALRNALRFLLGKTLLVNNKETAEKCVSQNSADFAVTLNGELYSRNGIIRGGSVSKKEGLAVGKMERISQFEKEIEILNAEVDKLTVDLDEKNALLGEIDLDRLNTALKNKKAEFERINSYLTQLSYRRESFNKSISMHEENIVHQKEELNLIAQEDESNSQELSAHEQNLIKAREELIVCQNFNRESELLLQSEQSIVRELELKEVGLKNDLSNLQKEINRLKEQITNAEMRISSLEREENDNAEMATQLNSKKEQINSDILVLNNESSSAKTGRELAFAHKSSVEEQISLYSSDLIALRKSNEKFVENIHQQEMKASDVKNRIKHIREKVKESYEIEIETYDYSPPENFSIDETKPQIADLKERLQALGSVNFLALEEYDAQSQRFEFYLAQVKDLTDSEKTLQETIDEINNTAELKFLNTFEAVNTNFKLLFKKLFGELGDCDLRLSEGSILESDIDIMAKPPGKKPHSIDMLSGGEKTLTSIALLFAIYMVKPSPFCILDEVDAPLDDANIDKFLFMIREFSNNTQFLVVTHNKRTMEFADTMYGITMQEEGVSKVVSVRLAPSLMEEMTG